MSSRPQNPTAQIIVGIAVILLGVMFLLDNLGWFDFDVTAQFWPMVLIFAGILKLSQSRSAGGGGVGWFLVLFGAAALLKGLGLFHVRWNVLAPLALIGLGMLVVYRSAMRGRQASPDAKLDADPDNVVRATAILGAYNRRMATQRFAGGEVSVVMAGCELDLREASIEDTAVLQVFALMGGIEIRVPVDWTVQLEGVPMLGGFEDSTLRPKDGTKRLIVRGYAIMGGMEIRN